MRRRPRGRRLALVAAAALVTLGCAGCAGREAEHDLEQAADVSTCHADATAAPKPYGAGFPGDWPFPPGTSVYHAEDRGADGTIVTGISASGFNTVLGFMNRQVVSAGFGVEHGETEEHDAEADWKGNGFHGRWAIKESADCPGETVIQVLSAKG